MKWTDRFIKLPTVIFDAVQNKLTDKEDYECDNIDSYKMILPSKIESYEPAMPSGGGFGYEHQTATKITMNSGDEILVFITIKEFEELINNHQK